jgi:hypothetical protein
MQILSQVMQMVPSVVDAASTGVQAAAGSIAGSPPPAPTDFRLAPRRSVPDAGREPTGGPDSGGPLGPGGGPPAAPARPLAPWTGASVPAGTGSAPSPAAMSTGVSPGRFADAKQRAGIHASRCNRRGNGTRSR